MAKPPSAQPVWVIVAAAVPSPVSVTLKLKPAIPPPMLKFASGVNTTVWPSAWSTAVP